MKFSINVNLTQDRIFYAYLRSVSQETKMVYDLNGNIIDGRKLNGLHRNVNFDRVDIETQKPESLNSGFYRDSVDESEKMNCHNFILADPPNFYNRKVQVISEIFLKKSQSPKILHKGMFCDRVTEEIKKPESLNSGFKRDSVNESIMMQPDSLIIVDPPNFCNRKGGSMSELPYYFITPVPKYFIETGWFQNENTYKFVTWAFSVCSTKTHKIVHDGREITLAPFEFIAGRNSSSQACFLTIAEFRNQLNLMLKAGLLKKSTNSVTNRFTCYIWSTDRFSRSSNQLNDQLSTNSQPTLNHNPDIENLRSKDHPLDQEKEEEEEEDLFKFFEDKIEKTKFQQAKIFLSKNYKFQVIKNAIARMRQPDFKPRVTWEKSLYAGCKGKWEPNEISEPQKKELRRKNKMLFDGFDYKINEKGEGNILTLSSGGKFDLREENGELERKLQIHLGEILPI
jgi:hypothetical protein